MFDLIGILIPVGISVTLFLTLIVLPIVLLRRQKTNHDQVTSRLSDLRQQLYSHRKILDNLLKNASGVSAEETPTPELKPTVDSTPDAAHGAAVKDSGEPEHDVPMGARVQTTPNSVVLPPAAPRVVAPKKPEHRQPSQFEQGAKEIVVKAWNWIIVGEEHRPTGVSMEYAIATNWLLRIGVLVLIVGIGFFLKYSVEHGLIGPVGRVSVSLLGGVSLLAVGIRLLNGRYQLLGQGLMGAGIATLYFAIFAAANFYQLIGFSEAFALMLFVTLCAGAVAVRFDSALVAVLGIIGGYGTPLILPIVEAVSFVRLFSYILILGIGVFGISYRKNWYILNVLSFLCTYGLFFRAMQEYQPDQFWQAMPFLVAFFGLFSTMIFIFNLVNRRKSTLVELLALLLNAGIFFVASYRMVEELYGRQWVSAVTLSLTAFYIGHIHYFLRHKLLDRELLLSFIGLAAFFLAVTIPLILSGEWITVGWAIQAFVLLWIAGKLNSRFLRQIAFFMYSIVFARFCFLDLPSQYESGIHPVDMPVADYLQKMVERFVIFGVPIASIAGACRLLKRPLKVSGTAVEPSNDIGEWIRDRWTVRTGIVGFLAVLFLYLHIKLNHTFSFFEVMFYDGHTDSVMDTGIRLLDFGAIIAFFLLASYLLRGDTSTHKISRILDATALVSLFLFLTLELNTCLHRYVPGLRAGGISALWSLFALSLVLAGIRKQLSPLRWIGLALFTIVTWKIFFVDLNQLNQIYRIIAFILLGVLILSGSFVYLRHRESFTIESDDSGERKE